MRFSPRIGYSRFDGGRTELRGHQWWSDKMTTRPGCTLPVVGVKHLKLREVPVERGNVLHSSAPECADFENVAWRACDLHMRK